MAAEAKAAATAKAAESRRAAEERAAAELKHVTEAKAGAAAKAAAELQRVTEAKAAAEGRRLEAMAAVERKQAAEAREAVERKQAAEARAAADKKSAEDRKHVAAQQAREQAAKTAAEQEAASKATATAAETQATPATATATTVAPTPARPHIPKLNMQAVFEKSARDFDSPPPTDHPIPYESAAANTPLLSLFPAPVTTTPTPQPSVSSLSSYAAQNKASALKAGKAAAAPTRTPALKGPCARPVTAPASAAKAKPAGVAAVSSSSKGGYAATATPVGVGRARRNSASVSVSQARTPGSWAAPFAKGQMKDQQQGPASGARQPKVRRASCTAALMSGQNATGTSSRVVAMSAALSAVKEAATRSRTDNQNRIGSARGSPLTFGSPVNNAHSNANERYAASVTPPAGSDGAAVNDADEVTPTPVAQGVNDLSLAWATTPYTSLTLAKNVNCVRGSGDDSENSSGRDSFGAMTPVVCMHPSFAAPSALQQQGTEQQTPRLIGLDAQGSYSEEWGSPDDCPVRDQSSDQSSQPHSTKSIIGPKLLATSMDDSNDLLAVKNDRNANFSFTSEIGALRMSTFEPAALTPPRELV